MSHWIIHLQAAMLLMLVRVNIHIVGGLQAPDICPFAQLLQSLKTSNSLAESRGNQPWSSWLHMHWPSSPLTSSSRIVTLIIYYVYEVDG